MSLKDRVPAGCPTCGATDRWEIRYHELRCAACNNIVRVPHGMYARELVMLGTAEWMLVGAPPAMPPLVPAPVAAPAPEQMKVSSGLPTRNVGTRDRPVHVVRDNRPIDPIALVDSGKVILPKDMESKVARTLPGMSAEMNIAGGQAAIGMLKNQKAAQAVEKQAGKV